jgi:hypothetical protein
LGGADGANRPTPTPNPCFVIALKITGQIAWPHVKLCAFQEGSHRQRNCTVEMVL